MKLIDTDALVAEIEKLMDGLSDFLPDASKVENGTITISEACKLDKYIALESFRNYIDTFEVKEVDLKEEIEKIWKPRFSLGWDDKSLLSISYKGFEVIAKHFFELGIQVSNKAQKGEKI